MKVDTGRAEVYMILRVGCCAPPFPFSNINYIFNVTYMYEIN